MKKFIAVLGDTYADVLVTGVQDIPKMGAVSKVSNPIPIMLGGSGANTSVLMRSLLMAMANIELEFFTSIGNDDWGILLRKHLENRGVKLREANIDGDVKNQAVCVVLSGDEGRGFIYNTGCLSSFTCNMLDTERILEADHLHLAGYFDLPGLWMGLPNLFKECKRRGITTSICPQTPSEKVGTGIQDLYPYTSLLIANEDEGRVLAGILPSDGVLKAATLLTTNYGIPLVVLTLGSRGAIAVWHENHDSEQFIIHWMKQRSKEHLSIVDSTGAGDAFIAGFLPNWKRGENLQMALQYGCACGSAACLKVGGSAPLSNEEIKDCLLEGKIETGSFREYYF